MIEEKNIDTFLICSSSDGSILNKKIKINLEKYKNSKDIIKTTEEYLANKFKKQFISFGPFINSSDNEQKYFICSVNNNGNVISKKLKLTNKTLSSKQQILNVRKFFINKFSLEPEIVGPLQHYIYTYSEDLQCNEELTAESVTLRPEKVCGYYNNHKIIGYHINEDPDILYVIFPQNNNTSKISPKLLKIKEILKEQP